MTQVAEKNETDAKVFVKCSGLVGRTGFSMAPDGLSPEFVEFLPGVATPMKKEYADYLVSQDSTRFEIVKAAKKDANTEDVVETKTPESDKTPAEKREAMRLKRQETAAKAAATRAANKAAKSASV